jgi:hypothetical protein
VVNECYDPLAWVRAKNFVISPGTPLPILTWPGDDWTIRTLTKHGIAYKIVFNGGRLPRQARRGGSRYRPRRHARKHGPVEPRKAKEYYLPPLPAIKVLLCVHLGLETGQALAVMKPLSGLFFEKPDLRQGEMRPQVSI